jgi:hypothetical protein
VLKRSVPDIRNDLKFDHEKSTMTRTEQYVKHDNSTILIKRDTPGTPSPFLNGVPELWYQRNPVDELKTICQPAGMKLDEVPAYFYRQDRPYSARVYVIDSGLAPMSYVSIYKLTV